MASSIPMYDLASNGDVILTLRLTRLRVSSAVMSTASPIFRAMFEPNFLVGHGVHSPQHPKEIPLGQDDSNAMMRLCYLLHHQRDPSDSSPLSVSSVQGAKEFLTMVVLAKAYGCTHSVNMVSAEPLSYFADPSTINASASIEALLHLIAATYVLEDRRQFARFTGYLVLYYEKPYSGLLKQPVLALLPSSFLLHVVEQRLATLKALRESASKFGRGLCLPCLRDGSLVGAQCQHRKHLEEWVENEDDF